MICDILFRSSFPNCARRFYRSLLFVERPPFSLVHVELASVQTYLVLNCVDVLQQQDVDLEDISDWVETHSEVVIYNQRVCLLNILLVKKQCEQKQKIEVSKKYYTYVVPIKKLNYQDLEKGQVYCFYSQFGLDLQ
ncbi:Hypothetical_protein [Hexamita inflata]|uniref:Hypothetical_protein n=1 Tax=Hexamita inflata TaxID=28002 RepID=A0AA86QH50_9EUKA|nr:Hypothetical protein HINF_LOCUS46325 [Hexamita inflata]